MLTDEVWRCGLQSSDQYIHSKEVSIPLWDIRGKLVKYVKYAVPPLFTVGYLQGEPLEMGKVCRSGQLLWRVFGVFEEKHRRIMRSLLLEETKPF